MSYKRVYSPQLTGKMQRDCSPLTSWRWRITVGVRIVFGCIWAINAWSAWQSAIQDTHAGYLTKADVQQHSSMAWINFWLHVVSLNPHLFAFTLAAGEAGIAIGLLFGIFSNLTCLGGILLSLCLCVTTGGTMPGTTDNGVLIVYMLSFAGLLLSNAGGIFGMDRYVASMLGRWSFLAARPPSLKRSPDAFIPAHISTPAGYPQLVLLARGQQALSRPTSSPSRRQAGRQWYPVPADFEQDTLEKAATGSSTFRSRLVAVRSKRLSRM